MQSNSDEKSATYNNVPDHVDEEEAPPQFSEEWTRPSPPLNSGPPAEGTSSSHTAFPTVGEMPIPNVSPMTAHVHPLISPFANVSSILLFSNDLSRYARPQSQRARMQK